MDFIKKFCEDKGRVGISIICLFMLCIGIGSAAIKDTYSATGGACYMCTGVTTYEFSASGNAPTSTCNGGSWSKLTDVSKCSFTATFDKNGGDSVGVSSKSCSISDSGTSYACDITLTTASYSGYKFAGWVTDSATKCDYSDSSMYSSSDEVTLFGDTNFYACWNKLGSYQITFDSNLPSGAVCTPSGIPSTLYKTEGETVKITSTTPVCSGLTFFKWKDNVTQGYYSAGDNYINDRSATLYAQWTKNDYTVTYDNNDGSGCSTKDVTYANSYGTLCTPSRDGYNFVGWYLGETFNKEVTSSTVVTTPGNHTLYAKWEYDDDYNPNYYITADFDVNGGDAIPIEESHAECIPDSSTSGCKIFSPSDDPICDGYTFNGWVSDTASKCSSNDSYKYLTDEEITIFQNTDFYACWVENGYTVTFNPYGGSFSTAGVGKQKATASNNYTVTAPTPTPAQSYFTFNGWVPDNVNNCSSSSVKKISAGADVTVSSDKTYYACWGKESYTLTYYANGGSIMDYSGNSVKTRSITVSSNTVTLMTDNTSDTEYVYRTGYKFLGWVTNSASKCSNSSYRITKLTAVNDTNVYACWEDTSGNVDVEDAPEVTFDFNNNGGIVSITQVAKLNSNGDWYVTARDDTWTGYTLVNWKVNKNYCGNDNMPGYSPKSTIIVSGDITYYACWVKNSSDDVEVDPIDPVAYNWTATFNPNGGTLVGKSPVSCTTAVGGISCSIIQPTATWTGHIFTGWGTSPSCTVGRTVTTLYGNQAFYACWEKDSTSEDEDGDDNDADGVVYTATFNPNGGILKGNSSESCSPKNGSKTCSVTTPTASLDGMTFKGWGENPGCTSGKTGNISLSSSKNYYACWISNDKDNDDKDNDDDNVDKNKENDVIDESPDTGTVAVVMVWAIGLAALGYSIYHFRNIIFKKNK